MRKKGHFGVSMGTVMKKKKKVDSHEVNCMNCTHFFKGICRKLNEISEGKQKYISDNRAAKKCKYYYNKHTQLVPIKSDNKKKKPELKTPVSTIMSIGDHCKLFKECQFCRIVKHFTDFQSSGSFTKRKNYCRECKIHGRVPGKSGDPKILNKEIH
jgi:hypothetical protein